MDSDTKSEKISGKGLGINFLNFILNNDIISFLIVFGLFIGIIFLLIKVNPGNLIHKFPTIAFWIFFLIILLASCIFYFITIYKYNQGEIAIKNSQFKITNQTTNYCPYKQKCIENKCYKIVGNVKIEKGTCKKYTNFYNPEIKNIFGEFISQPLKIILNVALLFGLVILLIYFIQVFQGITIKLFQICMIFLMLITALGIIYLFFFSPTTKNPTEKSDLGNFIKDLFFFIPCLFLKLIEYIKYEFNITTKLTWILLFLEILLIIFYFLIPYILQLFSTRGGQKLLKGPIYTNYQTELGKINSKTLNYSIGLQLWINPQPENTDFSYSKWTSLFNYGNRPNILYNGKNNTLKIVSLNKKNEIVTVYKSKNFPYQSWMKFVIIYRGSIIDVFLNNKLVGTVSNILPYTQSDIVTSGTNNGIQGAIKEVIYFNRILDKNEIIWVE